MCSTHRSRTRPSVRRMGATAHGTTHRPPSAVAACETTASKTTASPPSSPHGPTLTSSSESDDSSVRRRPNRKPLYGSRFGNRLAQKRRFCGLPEFQDCEHDAAPSRRASLGRLCLPCESALLAKLQTRVHALVQRAFVLRYRGRNPLSARVPARLALARRACHVWVLTPRSRKEDPRHMLHVAHQSPISPHLVARRER